MIKKKAFKNLEINSKDSGSFQKFCLFLVKYNMISFVVLLIYNKFKKKQSKIVKFNVKLMNWWIYNWNETTTTTTNTLKKNVTTKKICLC